jgi:hypothetical protein
MSKSLDEIKEEISQKYLGKSGIHGIGIRRKQNALYVYKNAETNPAQTAVLEKIKKDAAPYSVVTVEEDSPKIN